MTTPAAADFAREKRLIEQLEFRIASADSSEKLQGILQKFLPALVLKLGSEDVGNRNLTIKVCQYINQRLKIDEGIQLPAEALSKTFRESSSAFVKQFSIIFIQQGLARLSPKDGVQALPAILRSSITTTTNDRNDERMFTVAIDFLLTTLRHWKPPEHASKEDESIKALFDISSEQSRTISNQLSQFLLYDPKTSQTAVAGDGIKSVFDKHFATRSTIVPNLANFIFTSVFTDDERFIIATILSVDANATASSKADIMFKQCNFDLESDDLIDAAFNLYDVAKPKLRTRILNLLARSSASTTRTEKVVHIIESQLSNPETSLEASKLRAAMFSYLVWAIRVSPTIRLVAARLQGSLKDFIELQGWPTASALSSADVELRAKAYESIGLLAASENQGPDGETQSSFTLVSWLFTSLRCDAGRDVKHSIEESLGRLMASTVIRDPEELRKFKDLLIWNILASEGEEDPIYYMPTRTSAQYPAIRFANKILPLADVDARLMDLLALASDRREVVEEGHHGLDPSWHTANTRLGSLDTLSPPSLPTFAQFASRVFDEQDLHSRKEQAVLRSPAPLSSIVTFSRNLIAVQAWTSTRFAVNIGSNWQAQIEATINNEQEARALLKRALKQESVNQQTRLLHSCYEGIAKASTECGRVGLQLTSLASNSSLEALDEAVLVPLELATRSLSDRHMACRIIGVLVSSSNAWQAYVASAIADCQDWQTAVGQETNAVEGSLLKAAYVLSRAALRGSVHASHDMNRPIWNLCTAIIQKSTSKSLRQIAYISIGQLALCLPPASEPPKDLSTILDVMLADAKKENEVTVAALGRYLSQFWSQLDKTKQSELLDKLYDLHEVRKAEFHFALGEAFAVAALRFESSSTVTEFDVDADVPHPSAENGLFVILLDAILTKCQTTKPALKKAAGIWLLSLIQFCTNNELLRSKLRQCQAAFSRLLGDRDEIVQETGSRGLGLVYEKGDKNLRDDLVRDLVQSFTGNSAKTGGMVTEDTQLFEPGALPTENGQSVTTYKDIVSLAQEMGDPSLVYRFMNLASNNAIWTSRAAFGRFGLSGVLADSQYLQENKKFYPKLFRYRFDPNPNVQRSMDDIWKALVKDSNATVDEHFDLIMEDLLKSIVYGKEWRAREASCAAISDLVQGREVEKFEKYLDEIWKVAFKVLDDVKESVRVAAMKLCRTLTNMLIRNLEVGEGTTKRATTMLKHGMPFLLQQMEVGAAKEVQQYAIITLLDVVKKAPPRSLQSYAPIILETLVNSLSSLEHESINYLHLNADKYGLTSEKLDNMRVNSVSASPVSEAIEKCLDSLTAGPLDVGDGEAMDGVEEQNDPVHDAMRRLEASFKTTIGLPSRVGLGRVMITLVVRHHVMFRPFADRFVRIVRKSILDRNATISQSFSTALAYLLRLASEKEVRQTIAYAQKLYFESQEVSHRAVAGEIVQAVSKASNDVFTNFATSFLPFAFIGRKDLEEDVRDRFESAWKDNVGGARALHLYLKEIVELTSTHIKSSLWPVRHACCFAVAELVTTMETGRSYSRDEADMLWPLVQESVNGKTWDGKEKVVVALPEFVKRAEVIWTDTTKQMKAIVMREARRNNSTYRPHALAALANFAKVRTDLDMSADVIPLLVDAVETLLDSDEMELDGKTLGNGRSSTQDECLCSVVKCLFSNLRASTTADVLEQSMTIIQKAHSQASNKVEMSLCQGVQTFVEDVVAKNSEKNADYDGQKFERFLHELVLALVAPDRPAASSTSHATHGSDPESLRLARAQMTHQLSQIKTISLATREILDQVFRNWLESERSRPLRELIQETAQFNKASMSSMA